MSPEPFHITLTPNQDGTIRLDVAGDTRLGLRALHRDGAELIEKAKSLLIERLCADPPTGEEG